MRLSLLLCLLLAAPFRLAALDTVPPAPFELRDGDRVVFLGDTLLERENTYGYLETRMHEQFPERSFIVRNLSWAGDTPRGWSRASFDAPEKGFERLKEAIALVQPTVVFLGYGMAASLQEMTDRAGDITLNRDETRYGAEAMSAGRFKKELGELMDAIVASAGKQGGAGVRFVLLSPIRHEDLRAVKPGFPDPAEHNKLLEQYSKAIEELAKERGVARFANLFSFKDVTPGLPPSDPKRIAREKPNGIHLSEAGYLYLPDYVFSRLGWPAIPPNMPKPDDDIAAWKERYVARFNALRAAVLKKNDLWFHRFRPENATYLFGFRKHEQGQNAKEIPEFDKLVAAADTEIDRLKRAPATAAQNAPAPKPENTLANATPPPLPAFTVLDGYQIELWAQNPLMEKPTQMNWDADGRLWVCSSSLYPQIAPGEAAHDKILILEDTDRDGKADKSTVFADGLLIPTGVAPDLVLTAKQRRSEGGDTEGKEATDGKTPAPSDPSLLRSFAVHPSACYVAQSTELLRFEDTDGDGRADQRRVVFSGFGTEDTHHLIHTLRWGPDGRLYFNQSIYIHSHLETPWGMVRLNSGGTFAYDPRTERVEVLFKGFCNPWGHAWDEWGQSFLTDGAGFQGITWGIPGAMYFTYEHGRKIAPSISPGTYPKFCGLELIYSPHFPADWQGSAVTCDFRAHRIVRFAIEDLAAPGKGAAAASGYVTKEQPDLVRTGDQSFRPIDIRLGPDGALYVADWSNPVINHGEVDFRDPRRDKHLGRIWRITKKDRPVVKWEPLVGKKNEELLEKLLSKNAWEQEQARILAYKREEQASEKFFQENEALARDAKKRAKQGDFTIYDVPGPTPPHHVLNQRSGGQFYAGVDFPFMAFMVSIGKAVIWDKVGERGNEPRLRAAVARLRANQIVSDWTGRDHSLELNQTRDQDAMKAMADLITDAKPRVRIEAMRALARIPTARSAELVLQAALNHLGGATSQTGAGREDGAGDQFSKKPFDETKDPHYGYAAWLSINDLAKPWTDAIASGAWTADTADRQMQLEWGLRQIDPALAGATLSKLMTAGKVPLDGTGPWLELLGSAGGAKELQPLWDGLLVSFAGDCCETDETRTLAAEGNAPRFNEAAGQRAAAALLAAARLRNARPAARTALAPVLFHAGSLRAPAVELAGLWKAPGAVEKMSGLLSENDLAPELRGTIFKSLRTLGSAEARQLIEQFVAPTAPAPARREAVVALAALDLRKALGVLPSVLATAPDEATALALWRELLATKGAADEISAHAGKWKDLPKPAAAAGVRAAREAGKNGAKLLAALTPLAGLSPTEAPKDMKWIADLTKRDGDPARGELIYRRAALACVTCHAIGGAGGKVGPDMTSLGASAPLDYIIESVLQPALKVKEGYHAVALTLKDGTQAAGVQSRETAEEVFLRDVTGAEKRVPKAQIASTTNIGSLMPAGMVEQLPERERLDMFAFLGELGKPGPYDASKGTVARAWKLSNEPPAADGTFHVNAAVMPAYTLVDGRLLKEQLGEVVPFVSARGEPVVYAVTQFQSSGSNAHLKLTGAEKASLDGKPFVIGEHVIFDLAPGVHTLVVKIDVKALPALLRAESPDARFLGN